MERTHSGRDKLAGKEGLAEQHQRNGRRREANQHGAPTLFIHPWAYLTSTSLFPLLLSFWPRGGSLVQGDDKAEMRAAIIQQIETRLADEQPGMSLESFFESQAVAFEMVREPRARE